MFQNPKIHRHFEKVLQGVYFIAERNTEDLSHRAAASAGTSRGRPPRSVARTCTCKYHLLIYYCFGKTSNSVRFNSILRSLTHGLRQWTVDTRRRPSLNRVTSHSSDSENAPRETTSDVIAERSVNQNSVLFWAPLFFSAMLTHASLSFRPQSALVIRNSALMGGIPDTPHAAVNHVLGERKAPSGRTCDSSTWSSVRDTQSAVGGKRDYRPVFLNLCETAAR